MGINFSDYELGKMNSNGSFSGIVDFIEAKVKKAGLKGHGDTYYQKEYIESIQSTGLDFDLQLAYNRFGKACSNEQQAKELFKSYRVAREAWANIFAAQVVKGEQLNNVKKYMPNMYEEFLKAIRFGD